MKTLIAIALLTLSLNANAATAYWTGQMQYVQTVTYSQGVNCQYNLHGQTFWRTFISSFCPSSVEVY